VGHHAASSGAPPRTRQTRRPAIPRSVRTGSIHWRRRSDVSPRCLPRICLSSVRSETARRSRSFAFSRVRRWLQPLQPAQLVTAEPAMRLAPAVVRDLAGTRLPDRLRHRHASAAQNRHPPQPADTRLHP
jgi:predicted RNase H-like nuclease